MSKASIPSDADSVHVAFEKLLQSLKQWGTPPEDVQRALVLLAEAIEKVAGVNESDQQDEESAQPRYSNKDQRAEAGLSTRRPTPPQRHDGKRAPAGFEYVDGFLVRKGTSEEATVADFTMAESLLLSMACWFKVTDQTGRRVSMHHEVQRLVAAAEPRCPSVRLLPLLASAHEAYFERSPSVPSWAYSLVSYLKTAAIQREEVRLRAVHGDPPPDWHETALDGAAVLARLRAVHGDPPPDWHETALDGATLLTLATAGNELPPELTAQAIDQLIADVGIGRGGRGGKQTAEKLVARLLTLMSQGQR